MMVWEVKRCVGYSTEVQSWPLKYSRAKRRLILRVVGGGWDGGWKLEVGGWRLGRRRYFDAASLRLVILKRGFMLSERGFTRQL